MASSTGNTRLFLDANILLEIILDRPKQDLARRLLAANPGNRYISALTGHLIMHFGTDRTSLDVLEEFIDDYTLLALESTDFSWAFKHRLDNDFEDALQLAVAIRNGCCSFVTLDQTLYSNYHSKLKDIDIKLLK